MKVALLDAKDSATKGYGFDSYAVQPFEDILEPVLSHEVSENGLCAE